MVPRQRHHPRRFYKAQGEQENPTLSTALKVLHALGTQLLLDALPKTLEAVNVEARSCTLRQRVQTSGDLYVMDGLK